MKNSTLAIIITLLIAIVIVAVGFASIATVNLIITGNASASAGNFVVKLTGTPETTKPTGATAEASISTDGKTGTLTVSGLTKKDQTATATFTVSNESEDIDATLSAAISTYTNTEYFEVTKELADTEVAAGDSTTVTITVKLLKTPIDDQVSGEFKVTVSADAKAN